jgi:hypothetical protein
MSTFPLDEGTRDRRRAGPFRAELGSGPPRIDAATVAVVLGPCSVAVVLDGA